MKRKVTGVFTSRAEAERAITQIESLGVTESQVSLLMSDETRGSKFKFVESSKADEGAAAGAGVGGLVGTLIGGLLSAGAIAIPGMNLVIAGSLVSALAGLGAGAISGGLVGGLIGAGIPEHEAKFYEKEIKAGSVLVVVEARDGEQADQVESVFRTAHAYKSAA